MNKLILKKLQKQLIMFCREIFEKKKRKTMQK